MEKMTVIQIDKITVTLDRQPILKDFDLQIKEGEKVAVLGASGAGKSTLLKALIGMHVPVRGSILIAGLPFTPKNLAAIRRRVFYLPQDIVPHEEETVQQYLQYPFGLAVNKNQHFPTEKMNELLEKLRLKSVLLAQPLYKLSGGERKRVGLLQGLLLARPLIFADEPTAGVDAANRELIGDLLFDNSDTTVVAVTHDDALIARSDKKVEMKTLTSTGSVL